MPGDSIRCGPGFAPEKPRDIWPLLVVMMNYGRSDSAGCQCRLLIIVGPKLIIEDLGVHKPRSHPESLDC